MQSPLAYACLATYLALMFSAFAWYLVIRPLRDWRREVREKKLRGFDPVMRRE